MELRASVEPLREAFDKREYCPVVVMQICNSHGDLLLVQAIKDYPSWGLPQSIIKRHEDLNATILRSVHDGLGIFEEQLTVVDYSGFEDLDFSPEADKHGCVMGERYFFVKCLSSSGGLLNLVKDLANGKDCGYVWVEKKNQEAQVRYWLENNRDDKRELTLRHLFPKNQK